MTAAAPTRRQRLGAWIAGKRDSTQAIPFLPSSSENWGPGLGNQPSHETLLRESLGIAATATRATQNRVSTLNPLVKVSRREMAGTLVDETLDNHPLKVLLDRPHPNYSRAQLLGLTTSWVVTVGEAYWLKVGNGFGIPTELHPMPPGNVTPLVRGGVVVGYKVRNGDGRETELPPEVVVRFFFPDPENPWASEGYLGPEGVTADSLKFAGQHLRRHYETDATPKTVLETGERSVAFTKDEKDRFDVEWVKKYHSRLGMNQGPPAVLPDGYKLVEMALRSGADITPLLEFWRDEQLMGFGTPRSVLGQVVSGDRSAAETNQWVFDRYTVLPIATLISDAITLQLAPDFDSKIFVEFEPFVSADKKFELEKQTADLLGKVRSVNQVREDDGLDPVEWGDLPVATIGQQPYDPDAFLEMPGDVPGALGDDEEPDEDEDEEPRILPSVQRKRMRAHFNPQSEWERQIRREKKFVPAFLKAQRSIFKDQLRSVLANLQAQEDVPRARAINPELLFDPAEWERLFRLRVEPVRAAAFTEILQETLAGLGTEEAFFFTDAMQATLRDQGAQLVKHANATTKRRIAAALHAGTAEGEGISELAKRITKVFRVRNNEARTIARTEVLKASQQAQLDGFEASGVVERKSWNTNRDPDVRDSHAFAAGQVRDVGDPFDLAGEMADAPGVGAGGTALSAANTINCRCFLLPVFED